MAIQGIHPIPIIANSLSNATISIKKYRTEQKISSVCITITIGKNPALPSRLPAHHMHIQLLIGDRDPVFIEFQLHRLLQFIEERPIVIAAAPDEAGDLDRVRIVRLHADHGRGIIQYHGIVRNNFVQDPLCQGNIIVIADAVGQIQPAFILGGVVDDAVGGQVGIRDNDALVVDRIERGVHKADFRHLAGNSFQLNKITAFEGLADEDLQATGKLGDAVLQADARRHASRAQGGNEGAEIDAQRGKGGEHDAEFNHQLHHVADEGMDSWVNVFRCQAFHEQVPRKLCQPKADRERKNGADEIRQEAQ